MKIEVKNLESMTVACIHHIGPFQGNTILFEKLFEKLCSWAGPKQLMGSNTIFLSVYYNDPKKVKPEEIKMGVGLTIPEDMEMEDGEIKKQKFEGGKFVVARVKVKNPNDYLLAWDKLYRVWIPNKGYKILDRPCFELYRNDPKKDPEGKQIVDLCVPIE